MELRHLRYFITVATEGNFTRAAERLGLAQPPLSRQIRDLEKQLGQRLFDRDSRPIALTDAGRLLLEHAQRVVGSVEQLHRALQSFTESGRRRYAIGFVGSTIFGTVPLLIRRFKERRAHQPAPMPQNARPPLSASSVATVLARIPGARNVTC